jgi:hypothetical protein
VRQFRVVATGQDITDTGLLANTYIDTFFLGPLVFHLFSDGHEVR